MKEVEWVPSESIRLVQEYRARPELWDASHPRYRVASLKHMRWTELADALGVELAEVRKRLNSVLASHRRELKRIRGGGYSGWYLYEYLSFLPSHIANNDPDAVLADYDRDRRSPSASPSPAPVVAAQTKPKKPRPPIREVLPSSASDDDDDEGEGEGEYLDFDSDHNPPPGPVQVSIKTEPDIKPRRGAGSSSAYRRTTKPKHKLAKPMKPFASKLQIVRPRPPRPRPDYARKKDECDSFGEYIADSLRKHDERTQSMIKQAINNIIFEQEMKKYSHQFIVTEHHNPLILGDGEE